MEETPITIIGIVVGIIIMFVVPLMLVSDRADDLSQLVIQTATADFVDEVIKTGKITNRQYSKFVERLATSGNTYDIDMELKILDENTSKIVTDSNKTQIGNNSYYSIFTSQIEEMLFESEIETNIENDGKILLKQGDAILITVSNNSKTLSQSLKTFFSGTRGNDIKIITATASGTVAINGTR